jgi:hypothetical protein
MQGSVAAPGGEGPADGAGEPRSHCLAPDRLGRPPHGPGHQRASRRAYGPGRPMQGSVAAPGGEPRRVPRMKQASRGLALTAWAARPTAQAISGRAA